MKRNTLIIAGIMLLLSIVAVSACAHGPRWGWGQGYGHMMGPDSREPGWHSRDGHCQKGYYGNLSAEEKTKLDQQRSEYFKATEDIRQKLYEKDLALRSELAKENPDTSRASGLQSEISKLQGELDQKRLEYEIQARKNKTYYYWGHRGYCPMMGYGPRDRGY